MLRASRALLVALVSLTGGASATTVSEFVQQAAQQPVGGDTSGWAAIGGSPATFSYRIDDTTVEVDPNAFSRVLLSWYVSAKNEKKSQTCDMWEAALNVCTISWKPGAIYVSNLHTTFGYLSPSGQQRVLLSRRSSIQAAYALYGDYPAGSEPVANIWLSTLPFFGNGDFKGAVDVDGNMKVFLDNEEFKKSVRSMFATAVNWKKPKIRDLRNAGFTFGGVLPLEEMEFGDGVTPDGTAAPADGAGGAAPTIIVKPTTCKTPSGQETTSQAACAPNDAQSNCSILDIPCNLRYLFIPRQGFFEKEVPKLITDAWKIPVQVTDKFEWGIQLEGIPHFNVGMDFSWYKDVGPVLQTMKRIMWFLIMFWAWNFLGLPNPFGRSHNGGGSIVGDGVQEHKRGRFGPGDDE